MIKTRWVRRALVVGATVSALSVGCLVLQDTSDASTLCQEAELAGISLSMDKYYTATYAETDKEPEVAEEPEATEAPEEPTAAPTQEPEAVKEPSKYENIGISIANDYVNIRKRASEDSKILGKLYRGAAATIVKTKGDWVKISSGSVNGYIKKEYLAIGDEAEKVAEKFGNKIATVNTTTLKVRQKKSTESLVLTLIPDEESYNVMNEYDKWVKIKVDGDTKGYVAKEYVDISIEFDDAISIKEEKEAARRKAEAEAAAAEAEAYQQAQQEAYTDQSSQQEPQQQSYSDNGSSNSGSSNGGSSNGGSSGTSAYKNQGTGTGSDVAAYAQKFVGNPYVYGGTSLTNGADCSGFVMSVYARFGYSLPRVAASQAGSGTKVSLDSVQPGDLIFYGGGSGINHVAMYVGNGTVVHASNEREGIKYSDMFYRTPTCARRIIND